MDTEYADVVGSRFIASLLLGALGLGACSAVGTATPATPSAASVEPAATVATSAASHPSTTSQPAATTKLGSRVGAAPLPGDPRRSLTPGALNPAVTQVTIGSTICVSGWTTTVRPPSSYTTNLKRQQIVTYRYADTNLSDYEEDHLIPLEVGGAPSDPRNLWPEPYAISLADGTPVGARVKDQLENKLHSMVCSGQLPLSTAQHEIATDWVRTRFALTGRTVPAAAPGAPATTTAPLPTAVPAAASAAGRLTVTITSLTSPVARGASATLVARTAARASCTITVVYKSGPSTAQGLGATTANGSGAVSWTWTVGARTTTGSWPVTVACSTGGSIVSTRATLVVR